MRKPASQRRTKLAGDEAPRRLAWPGLRVLLGRSEAAPSKASRIPRGWPIAEEGRRNRRLSSSDRNPAMRAVVLGKSPRFVTDHPDPRPQSGECLVRVRLAGLCATDVQLVRGYMNFRGVLGHEMVGTVVQGSSAWKGKRVVAEINCVCGQCDMCHAGLSHHCRRRTVMGIAGRDGCFADHLAVPERNLHLVPDALADEEAVFVEPLAAAYQVIAQCPVDSRTKVSVVGTGKLGLLVAQVLASKRCRLIAVGRNPATLTMCDKLGIQAVHVNELEAKQDQDLVVECSGSPRGLEVAMQLVRPRGTIVLKSTCAEPASLNLASIVVNEVNVLGSRCGPFPEAINALARRAVEVRLLISRVFPVEQALQALDASTSPENLKILLHLDR